MRIAIGGIMHESNTFARPPDRPAAVRGGEPDSRRCRARRLARGAPRDGRLHRRRRGGSATSSSRRSWPGPRRRARSMTRCSTRSSRRSSTDAARLGRWPAAGPPRRDGDGDGIPTPTARSSVASAARSARTCPIVATLDYHANVSPAMAEHADALIGYQTYPHVDQREKGLAAAGLMARMHPRRGPSGRRPWRSRR